MEDIRKLIKKKIASPEVDSVRYHQSQLADKKYDSELLEYARRVWYNMNDFRENLARNYSMTYGDQWSDSITIMKRGKEETISMRDYMQREGHIPFQANMVKPMVSTILGVLVKEQNEPICHARDRKEQQYGEVMTQALQANCNKNRLDSVTEICVRDYIIGGLGVLKERYGMFRGRMDSWTEYINPNYLILDMGMKDPRYWDMRMVGTWYDMSPDELIQAFVKSPADLRRLKEIYGENFNKRPVVPNVELTDKQESDNIQFMYPSNPNECSVLEIWTKEIKQRVRLHDTNKGTLEVVDADDSESLAEIDSINAERRNLAVQAGWSEEEMPLIEKEYFIDSFWYCRMLAPTGEILEEFESPYPNKEQPFTIVTAPMADGRITGYITDACDLQIIMNRALCMYDWAIRNNVKGLTMIPKDAIPEDIRNEDFYEKMRIDNICIYDSQKAKGAKPEIFHGPSTTVDIGTMMQTIKSLMESSLSITGAIQGRTPYSGTSAAMYAQMTANSSTPIASVMKSIRIFLEDVAVKKLKNIAEFYDSKRFEEIVGSIDGIFDNKNLNLTAVGDIEFDLSIKEGTETPLHRQTINDWIISFMETGAITPEEALKHGYFPFADKILQEREARQAEMEAAQNGEMGSEAQQVAMQASQASGQMSARAANQVMDSFGTSESGNTIHSTRPIVR